MLISARIQKLETAERARVSAEYSRLLKSLTMDELREVTGPEMCALLDGMSEADLKTYLSQPTKPETLSELARNCGELAKWITDHRADAQRGIS